MVMVRAGIQCLTAGTVTGGEHAVPPANGTARGAGGRMVLPAGGLAVWGRASLLTGSGGLLAGLLIIRSRTGAARPGAGVIRNVFGCQFPAYQSRAHARAIGRFSARGPKAPTPPAGQAG